MKTTLNAETAETAEKTSRALFEYSCTFIRFSEQQNFLKDSWCSWWSVGKGGD